MKPLPFLRLAFCLTLVTAPFAASAQDGKYVPAGADMKSAVITKLPQPAYPSALAAGKTRPEGTTSLRVYVNASGALDKTAVTKSSGSPDLDKAAVTFAQKSFKFSPYTVNSKTVSWYFDYNAKFKAPAAAANAAATPSAPAAAPAPSAPPNYRSGAGR